jgi:energy-coupling factor transporter ATP-binding protein EcfA2
VRELNFNLGITVEQVASQLRQFRVLSIVGFTGSGKSTLAEILGEHLHAFDFDVFMQNASTWHHDDFESYSSESYMQARVDPEVVGAVKRLEDLAGTGCWIIDDAEVMLACTTEDLLRSVGKRLSEQEFFLVLIRNRFVLEEGGWLRSRQSLISPELESLTMQPLTEEYAIEVATSLFDGYSRFQQGRWLASMSGGIPGLMAELYPYTPTWPTKKPTPELTHLINAKKQMLNLAKPFRRMLITALETKVLPPPPLLSLPAKNELGTLILMGIISPEYGTKDHPFQGDFWKLVCEQHSRVQAIPTRLIDIGLNLEIMIREAELADLFCQELEIALDAEGMLAQAFAACLYCQEMFPRLVQQLDVFISENLGKLGLLRLLRGQNVPAEMSDTTTKMVEKLFQKVTSR